MMQAEWISNKPRGATIARGATTETVFTTLPIIFDAELMKNSL